MFKTIVRNLNNVENDERLQKLVAFLTTDFSKAKTLLKYSVEELSLIASAANDVASGRTVYADLIAKLKASPSTKNGIQHV